MRDLSAATFLRLSPSGHLSVTALRETGSDA
jgi:hypothetical protein